MNNIELRGEKVLLREFLQVDLDDANAIDGDDRVTRWLSFDSKTLDQSAKTLAGIIERRKHKPRTEYYLAVVEHNSDTDTVVGFVRLGLDGVKAAKLGFAIHADHWGKGYATDAARILTAFGFDELGLHRISCAIGPANSASITIAEKLGMRYEGRIRDHVYTNGSWRDSLLYSILEQEWKR